MSSAAGAHRTRCEACAQGCRLQFPSLMGARAQGHRQHVRGASRATPSLLANTPSCGPGLQMCPAGDQGRGLGAAASSVRHLQAAAGRPGGQGARMRCTPHSCASLASTAGTSTLVLCKQQHGGASEPAHSQLLPTPHSLY